MDYFNELMNIATEPGFWLVVSAVLLVFIVLILLKLRNNKIKKILMEAVEGLPDEVAGSIPQEKPPVKVVPEQKVVIETEPAPAPALEPEPEESKQEPVVEEIVEPKTLKEGLEKTRKGFIGRLKGIFRGTKKISSDVIEDIEEILYTADIGTSTATMLIEMLSEKVNSGVVADSVVFEALLKEKIGEMLDISRSGAIELSNKKPFLIMVVGVNGVGKTTTIAKIAHMYIEQGKSVMLAAGDTFRAAAVEQLGVWADRIGADMVKGDAAADPSSVIYNAVQSAIAKNIDVIIADTAGRLHTKYNLMEELKKIRRVATKSLGREPDHTLLVLDANTGQNAISQAKTFSSVINIDGIVLSKLDGTAKGGVIVGICNELHVPLKYIGIGEAMGDLRPFDAKTFTETLFE